MLQDPLREAPGRERAPKIHTTSLPLTLVVRAIEPLVPAAKVGSGRRQSLQALFDNRVKWRAIQHWLRGRRTMPDWARDKLKREHEARALEHAHIAALLTKEKAGD